MISGIQKYPSRIFVLHLFQVIRVIYSSVRVMAGRVYVTRKFRIRKLIIGKLLTGWIKLKCKLYINTSLESLLLKFQANRLVFIKSGSEDSGT